VDFDATLGVLLGLMGSVVSVHIRQPGSRAAPAVMLVSGPLTAAPDVVEKRGTTSEVFFCRIGNGPLLSGFFMDRERFVEAHWDDGDDPPSLVIELHGGSEMVVHEERRR